MHRAIKACAACLLGFCCAALGAPKVDDDGLPQPGERQVELQLDKASRPGPAAAGTPTPLNVVAEYAYGLRAGWQVALKLPLALERGRARGNGIQSELRYVAPHDEEEGGYWGMNFGLHYHTPLEEPHTLEAGLVPVLGYRLGRWHAIANLGMSLPLRPGLRAVEFSPAAKLAYQLHERHAVGLELFMQAGPLSNWNPHQERTEYLFLAWDAALKKASMHLGVGRGLTDASDRRVLKLIFALLL